MECLGSATDLVLFFHCSFEIFSFLASSEGKFQQFIPSPTPSPFFPFLSSVIKAGKAIVQKQKTNS